MTWYEIPSCAPFLTDVTTRTSKGWKSGRGKRIWKMTKNNLDKVNYPKEGGYTALSQCDYQFRVVLVLKSENALIGLMQTIGSWGGSLVGMKKSWSRVPRTIYSFKMKTGDTSRAWRSSRQTPWGKNSEPLKEFRCSMRTSQICVLWRQITVHFGEEISKRAKQNCKNSFEFRFCFPSYSWVPPSVPSLFTASVLIWSG